MDFEMAPALLGKRSSTSGTPEPKMKRRRMDNCKNECLTSLDRAVSPPPLSRKPSSIALQVPEIDENDGDIFVKAYLKDRQSRVSKDVDTIDLTDEERVFFGDSLVNSHVGLKRDCEEEHKPQESNGKRLYRAKQAQTKAFPSPFQLTWIRDLPDSENVDAITINDILGEVMIKEAWVFNFLIDLDWVMNQFDPDIKDIVDVKVVHGSWRKEDGNRIRLEKQASKYRNAKVISAYMPEPFGTHHTKMVVLIRHDELAQVIIHTSNMIEFDWTNMTQAIWRSPLLPLLPLLSAPSSGVPVPKSRPIGESFKNDLLSYLKVYGRSRVGDLCDKLGKYSFSEVRAVFIASVPGKYQLGRPGGNQWGWMGLKRILGKIPPSKDLQDDKCVDQGRIVVQVSSIATLGSTDTWLSPVLYKALSESRTTKLPQSSLVVKKPRLSIIFPTACEVRNSLNGYASGKAIHTRIQTNTQQSQLRYLRPLLHHWDSSSGSSSVQPSSSTNPTNLSGRTRAAPHIKTYIRFADNECRKIEWAMLTSANLSTQAWGTAIKNPGGGLPDPEQGEVKISSYEVGVIIYPGLFQENDGDVEEVNIVPVFKKDTPDVILDNSKGVKTVGLRMPYDLPIKPYGKGELPWCASKSYAELDWRGEKWEV